MPILVKGDDVKSGTKANAHPRQLEEARESWWDNGPFWMIKFPFNINSEIEM